MKIERRKFLGLLSMSSLGLMVVPSRLQAIPAKRRSQAFTRTFLYGHQKSNLDFPDGYRPPFDWKVSMIDPRQSQFFSVRDELPKNKHHFLRFTVACELREEMKLAVSIPEKDIYLGVIDIRYSSIVSPHELKIDKKYTADINQYGLEIKLEADAPLLFFEHPVSGADLSSILPQIISSKRTKGTVDDFLEQFRSLGTLQGFGWREGCVLDGLLKLQEQFADSRARVMLQQHLDKFFDEDQNLVYETLRGQTVINEITTIEATLPFAILAKVDPDHPALQTAVDSWEQFTDKDGIITGGHSITAEGCYTVAYPLAAIGKVWQRPDLKQKAIEELKSRFLLVHEGSFHLRYNQGNRTFRNWARGVAWYLLGMIRTISEIREEADDEVLQAFRNGVDLAISMQRKDGLWSCFLERDVLPDTAGSSGIGAAIISGVQEGILPKSYSRYAEKCWDGLQDWLTPDGFLRGGAQGNRGGMELQEGSYRVISQFGMGMMAQLYAGLDAVKRSNP